MQVVQISRAVAAAELKQEAVVAAACGRIGCADTLPAVLHSGVWLGVREQMRFQRRAAAVLHKQLQFRTAVPVHIGTGGKIGRQRVGLPTGQRCAAVNSGVVAACRTGRKVEI